MYRPEVGEECLVNPDGFGWSDFAKDYLNVPVTVCSYFKNVNGIEMASVSGSDGGCICVDIRTLRPLKSKRDEEIEEMRRIVDSQRVVSTTDDCSRLYDAGYRKQLPYSQFVSIIQVYISKEFGYNDGHSLRCATELAAKLNRTPDEG